MAAGEKRYVVKAAWQILKVAEFLAQGEILEWKTSREVAAGVELTDNMSYRLLETLVAAAWAEKGPKGYRQRLDRIKEQMRTAQAYFNRLGGLEIG